MPKSTSPADVANLPLLAAQMRRTVLRTSMDAHVGHIGSALSVVDILAVLFGRTLSLPAQDDPERDRFVLSKGHAALALYAALAATERIPEEALSTYCGDETLLGVHPERELSWVDFSTGSLGQGLSLAAGAALAARLDGSPRRSFALLSDAECNEGAVWEAAMFAAHHKLSNLTAIVDANGQQALGYTRDVLDLEPLADRWSAFGWHAVEVDGHDHDAMTRTLEGALSQTQPTVVIARTTFGKGVSFMENLIKWHYLPMSESEFERALAEIDAAGESR
ncbi:MAG: transketolase [Gaiellaceae bacterium]